VSGFSVEVDLGNPGQLLACCGLLEAADRRWRDEAPVTGHFEGGCFHVNAVGGLNDLLHWLSLSQVTAVLLRTDATGKKPKSTKNKRQNPNSSIRTGSESDDAARASPILLKWQGNHEIYLDSWSDVDFGRTAIKTFAGQQSSFEMVSWLLASLEPLSRMNRLENVLDFSVERSKKKSFNFDQRKGRSALDVGFSVKETRTLAEEFPATEILAAIGVQTCRPMEQSGGFLFGVWSRPLPVELARAAAGCVFRTPGERRFHFQLLGRKQRSGVSGAPNDQYKAFTRAVEIFDFEGEDDE
jgi:CRISPR-associated protein Csx14